MKRLKYEATINIVTNLRSDEYSAPYALRRLEEIKLNIKEIAKSLCSKDNFILFFFDGTSKLKPMGISEIPLSSKVSLPDISVESILSLFRAFTAAFNRVALYIYPKEGFEPVEMALNIKVNIDIDERDSEDAAGKIISNLFTGLMCLLAASVDRAMRSDPGVSSTSAVYTYTI